MLRGTSNQVRAFELTLLAACSLGATVSDPASRRLLEQLPDDVVERLFEKNWVLADPDASRTPGSEEGFLVAYVIFEKPRDETFALLAQTSRQGEYRPDISRVRTLEQSGDSSLHEYETRIMLFKIEYRLRYWTHAKVSRITWSLDPEFDNDVAGIDGFWQLYSLSDGRTLALLGTRVDVGPLLPSALQDLIAVRHIPKSIEHCQKWIESDGEFRR